MSTETVKPVGEKATQNYHRFGLAEADALLDGVRRGRRIRAEQDVADGQAAGALRRRAPRWCRCSPGRGGARTTRRRFTGWPTEDNPYATLSTRAPTTVLVLTTLEPVVGE